MAHLHPCTAIQAHVRWPMLSWGESWILFHANLLGSHTRLVFSLLNDCTKHWSSQTALSFWNMHLCSVLLYPTICATISSCYSHLYQWPLFNLSCWPIRLHLVVSMVVGYLLNYSKPKLHVLFQLCSIILYPSRHSCFSFSPPTLMILLARFLFYFCPLDSGSWSSNLLYFLFLGLIGFVFASSFPEPTSLAIPNSSLRFRSCSRRSSNIRLSSSL